MKVSEATVLHNNLSALSGDPALVEAIRAAAPDPRIDIRMARDGSPVPVVKTAEGQLPLHSLYSPAREAAKLRASTEGGGYLVFQGLGAGYQIAPFLEDPDVSAVLILEKDAAVVRALLESIPLERVFSDRRCRLVVGTAGLRNVILSSYQPAVGGAFRTLPLRPWCEVERAFFAAAARETEAALRDVQADFSVQAHFGKRWFANMLLNLEPAQVAGPALPHAKCAAVTAAGPSLTLQSEAVDAASRDGMVVATDTSLPTLFRLGLVPSLVLSIDCQSHGYRHFQAYRLLPAPLVLDLASPPTLARRFPRCAFFASQHPFSRYLRQHWRRFPRLDVTGGNVTYAAVSLARALGARSIRLFGADFSYPRGTPYARGSYLFDLFDGQAERVRPLEGQLFGMLFRSPGVQKEHLPQGIRYTTPLLSAYRDRLLTLMASLDATVTSEPGDGLPLPPLRPASAGTELPRDWSAPPPPAICDWRELLSAYKANVLSLPSFGAGLGGILSTAHRLEADTLATLLPVAATVIRERETLTHAGGTIDRAAVLEQSRAWILDRVTRSLSAKPAD